MKESSSGLSKEDLRGMIAVDQAFTGFRQKWMEKHIYTPDNETENFRKNAELATAVHEYIAGMKTYSPDPRASERGIRSWVSQVGRDFEWPSLETKLRIPVIGTIAGASPTAVAQQNARRRYYVKTFAEMLQVAGTTSSDLYATLCDWAKKAGYGNEQLVQLLASMGLTKEQRVQILNLYRSKYPPVERGTLALKQEEYRQKQLEHEQRMKVMDKQLKALGR